MDKEIVIFGTGKIAEVIYYYATEECGFSVSAFTVDSAYKKEAQFLGLPVIPFENIEQAYPSARFDMFVAIGYHDLNEAREKKYNEALVKGYKLVSIISPKSNLPKNVTTGFNCFIMPPALVHPCVKIGNNVFIWSGAVIGHHSIIGDNCWVTSGANLSGNLRVGKNCFFAINSTIGHSVEIGNNVFVGANALVIKNVEEGKVIIKESDKPIKLNSKQFLRISSFTNL